MKNAIAPLLSRVTAQLSYDPHTGIFRRLVRTSNSVRAGDISGFLHKSSGYWLISVDGKKYPAHRIAWLLHFGEWPLEEIDHRNINRSDNRIDNLRLASPSSQGANKGRYKNNTCGFKGASLHRQSGKWKSQIKHRGKVIHLGLYQTPEEAHSRYMQAAVELHGQFARAS